MNYLVHKGATADEQVLKMVIMVIAKVTKLSWFDHPEMQAVVQDLIKMCNTPLSRVALRAINDLIIELGYITKSKFLIQNRRISLNFRDSALFQILK